MITFGYKNKFNGPLRALTAIAVGVVMVLSKTNALELVVQIIAAFIFASGVVSMIVGYRQRKNGTMGLMGFNGIVDIVIGLALFPSIFYCINLKPCILCAHCFKHCFNCLILLWKIVSLKE